MSFVITYKEKIRITFTDLKDQTVADLKTHVAKHFGIENFSLLDLGRFMSDSERLADLDRSSFTIYLSKK